MTVTDASFYGIHKSVATPANPDVVLARRYGRGSFPWCCQSCGQDKITVMSLCEKCLRRVLLREFTP